MMHRYLFTKSDRDKIGHNPNKAQEYIRSIFPLWNISKMIPISGLAHSFDGIYLEIIYELKTEDEVFGDQMIAFINRL